MRNLFLPIVFIAVILCFGIKYFNLPITDQSLNKPALSNYKDSGNIISVPLKANKFAKYSKIKSVDLVVYILSRGTGPFSASICGNIEKNSYMYCSEEEHKALSDTYKTGQCQRSFYESHQNSLLTLMTNDPNLDAPIKGIKQGDKLHIHGYEIEYLGQYNNKDEKLSHSSDYSWHPERRLILVDSLN